MDWIFIFGILLAFYVFIYRRKEKDFSDETKKNYIEYFKKKLK